MNDEDLIGGWGSIVDRIVRGDDLRRPIVILGPTPELLVTHGLTAGSIGMTVAKLARCRREHPEVSLSTWRNLPALLAAPLAIFPSAHRDGSIIVVVADQDVDKQPVLVIAIADRGRGPNAILSVYGKQDGLAWIRSEIDHAIRDDLNIYEKNGFAASLPQPPVANATSSSHGLIPSDGTTKPKRNILTLGKDSTKS